MKRRTLLKGLATLPFLKHLDLSLSTPVEAAPWEMTLAEEGLKTGDGREIDWPKYTSWTLYPGTFARLDGGILDLGLDRSLAHAPLYPEPEIVMEPYEVIIYSESE